MVGNQITAQVTRVQQLMSMLQNLKNLDPATLAQMVLPYQQQLSQYQSLFSAVSSLSQAGASVQSLFKSSVGEMTSLNMTPTQWLGAFSKLATQRGGIYQQQMQQDLQSMSNFAARAQNLQSIAAQTPEISGNVQGLQLLNQQSNIAAGELMDIHALMQRQVTAQLQQRSDEATTSASAAALLQARQAAAASIDSQEKAAIDGGTFAPLVDH
jgi:conjugal transfer/entry exclusion protein